jgi:excisionase family DNA binding protein
VTKKPPPEIMPPPVMPAALRLDDAARYLSISPSLLRKLVKQGKLQTVAIGACRVIKVSSLDALLTTGS